MPASRRATTVLRTAPLAMLESNVLRQVWLAVARTTRLFRINTGRAWLSGAGPVRHLPDGSVVVPAARSVALGFGMPDGKPLVGTADLCGWTPVVVSPQMVGQTIAVFTAVETKKTKGGRTSDDQRNFIEQVREAGGIAGVANTPAVAQSIISDWIKERGAAPHV